MTKINSVVLILLVLSIYASARPLDCKWKSPSGEKYDFTSLHKKDNYQVKDSSGTMGMFDLLYVTNVCETVTCSGSEVSVYEGLQILGELTPNCDVITNASSISYGYIDTNQPAVGVQWTYSGEQCVLPPSISYDENNNLVTTPNPSNEIRTSTFSIYCSDDQSSNFTVDASEACHIKFRMSSPFGCIGATSNRYASFKVLLCLILLSGIYFAGGSYINKRKYGLTGVEALPHHSFWTDFPYLINDGFKLTLLKATFLIRYFKTKSGGSTSTEANTGTYNTI